MKYLLSCIVLFSFQFGFSQEQKIEIITYTTKTGQIIYDTLWKTQKVESKINNINGEIYLDTIWEINKKTNHKKSFVNPTLPATTKRNVSIGTLINNSEGALLGLNSIRLSYFIKDNFMIGTGLAGVYDLDISDFNSFNLTFFGRKYFGSSLRNKSYFEADLATDIINEGLEFGIGLGKTFFVGSNFGVDIGLGYKTDFDLAGRIVFGIGFQGIIPNKNK